MTDSPRLAAVLLGVDMDHVFCVDGDWYSCSCGRWGGEAQRVGHVEFRAHVCDEQAAALLARRDLLLEALGGHQVDGIDRIYGVWRFPASEEAQK